MQIPSGAQTASTASAGLNKSFAPSPASITSVTLSVTSASGNVVVSTTVSVVAGQQVTINLVVPSGQAHIFIAQALDAQGTVLFQGQSDPVDLEPGVPTSVTIQMQQAISFNLLSIGRDGTGSGTVISNPSEINCGQICQGPFNSGTVVTLTATPDKGSVFTGWRGAGCTTGTDTCTVTLTADATVTATFNLATVQTFILSVSKVGNGSGTVTSDLAGVSCGLDCSEPYPSGTVVTLTAAPNTGHIFSGWSGSCQGTGTCTVTMDAEKSVTASFTPDLGLTVILTDPSFTVVGMISGPSLEVPGNLGAVMLSPALSTLFVVGASESSSAALYGVPVTRDSAGHVSGLAKGTAVFSAGNMDAGLVVKPGTSTLFFTRYSNNVLSERVGTTITDYPLVNVGVPSSVGGAIFVPPGLPNSGDLLVSSWSSGQVYTLPLTGNGNGTFTPGQASLFVDLPNGAGGGIVYIPSGPHAGDIIFVNWSSGTVDILDIDTNTGLPVGGPLTPSITPFASGLGSGPWGLAFDPVSNDFFLTTWAGNPSNVIIQISGFSPPSPTPVTFPLTVSLTGTGAGSVTSTPPGISCQSDCTEDYLSGTTVTLTATPDAGSTFSGWSGACTGMGSCIVTMDSAKSVTATLEAIPVPTFTLTVSKAGTGSGTVTSNPTGINCGASCTTQSLTLFNTGLAADGTLLPGSSVDPHYALISSADSSFPGPAAIVANPIPSPFWFNDSNSQYVAPEANQNFSVCCSAGDYRYRTTFDLTGLDPSSATITGQWRSDDNGLILINGVSTDLTAPSNTTMSFTLSSGFIAGINTLDFLVTNTSGPSGLRVDELTGTAAGVSTSSFPSGTVVTLTAIPDAGSTFVGWSGDAECTDGVVTMDADKTCTATLTK
jgi:hypothetical protein